MIRNLSVLRSKHFPIQALRKMESLANPSGSTAKQEKKKIAICQITSTNEPAENFTTVKNLVALAKSNDAKMVFFPEACDYITSRKEETIGNASPLDSQYISNYCNLAKENMIWISLGSIHEKLSEEKIFNSHLIIDDNGKIVAVYRKLHLYDVNLPEENIVMQESAMAQQGGEIVPPVASPIGKIGMAICYDLRFPELSLMLTRMGAEILTFPAAFMRPTGEAHWEPLLRARAIESQCYVVAAAQTGTHNVKRSSWGHAMVVDPWGAVIAKCQDGDSIAYAEIDLAYLNGIRKKMPVWKQRRNDLYPSLICHSAKSTNNELCLDQNVYQFGQSSVKASCIFYRTALAMAFTNKRCVVAGHVLVSPIRCVKRMIDLTPDEVSNVFLVAQKVQHVMERVHNASASTICVQDGEDAGQTIKHLHVHILPRRPGDFAENDDIYSRLQQHDKISSPDRTESEMVQEALMLRAHFN